MNCIFCSIINGDIPSKKVYEDDMCYAFHDIDPQAAVHCLVIPKKHITSVDAVNEENADYLRAIFLAIPKIAAKLGLDKGYRVITNVGEHGAQTVFHLHFHIIGGEQLSQNIV